MTSWERVMARLHGEAVDRVPNLCILMGFAAKHAGIPFRDFCLNPEKMVQANLLCHKDFFTDIVTVMSDPFGEAMDHGLKVFFPENENPHALEEFWADTPTPDTLQMITNPQEGRMADRVHTIKLYADQVKGVCPIAGWVEGAVAEYCDLRNINSAMMDLAEEEPFMEGILEKITLQALHYIDLQIDAGADIIGVGDAACSLLGPRLYEKYAFPYEKAMVEEIHRKGALAKLHICGNITSLLPKITELHADIVDVDWMVDYAHANQLLAGISAVNGNFDPVAVVCQGNSQIIHDAVHACLEQGSETCMISAGCEIPPNTPEENLLAVARSLGAV